MEDITIELTASTITYWIMGSIGNEFRGKTRWELRALKQDTAYWKEIESVSQESQ